MKFLIMILVLFVSFQASAFRRSVNVPLFLQLQLDNNAWKTESKVSLLDTNTSELIINVGSKRLGILAQYEAGGAGTVDFFEGTTTSSDGTPVTIRSVNRNFSSIPLSTVFITPTITGDGTVIAQNLIPGDRKKGEFGGAAPGSSLIFLKANTKYLCRVTNTSGATNDFIIKMFLTESPL